MKWETVTASEEHDRGKETERERERERLAERETYVDNVDI